MLFSEIVKAVILGIIEGITEWLPISSTGHMILIDEFIKMNTNESFKEMFFVVIQFGAVLAVVKLFFHKLNFLSLDKNRIMKNETLLLWSKILIAVIPAGLVGLLFDDLLNKRFYNYQTVAVTLIFYGVLFVLIEYWRKGKTPTTSNLSSLSCKTAFMIGIFQVLALIPGTSRSGSTILGAMLLGVSRGVAAEFSFFLAIPIMLGASLLKILKYGFAYTSLELIVLLAGTLTSFLVSIIAVKYFMRYIEKYSFTLFGYYRIVLGLAVVLYFSFN